MRERAAAPVMTPEQEEMRPATASRAATAISLLVLLILGMFNTSLTPSGLARNAALTIMAMFALGALIEARHGLKNLIRADTLTLAAFYYFTLWEFLFPQPFYDRMTSISATSRALWIVETAFAGLLVGRHLIRLRRQPFESIMTREVPISRLLTLFWIAVALGYFYMLACSDWSIVRMTDCMMDARFTQPWQRGQLGDWRAPFSELALLLFLIPALGGMMIARSKRYPVYHLVPVVVVMLYTFFYGFASGTRNLFGTYLVNFLAGFGFATPPNKRFRIVIVGAVVAVAMVLATRSMLQFRTIGLKLWMDGKSELWGGALQRDYMFVDYNLLNMSAVASFFPKHHDYLGMEIPYLSIIRPIPRFLWPAKPVGMTVPIENIMGYAGGVTITATFAGESYITGGFMAVAIISICFGAFTGWWNHFASPRNSELGILIYATGFLASVIAMRSMLVFTTSLLPVAACIVVSHILLPKATSRIRRLAGRQPKPRPGYPGRPTARPGRQPPPASTSTKQ
jgi:hypothetical protein